MSFFHGCSDDEFLIILVLFILLVIVWAAVD